MQLVERNYEIYNKELLVIMEVLKKIEAISTITNKILTGYDTGAE